MVCSFFSVTNVTNVTRLKDSVLRVTFWKMLCYKPFFLLHRKSLKISANGETAKKTR